MIYIKIIVLFFIVNTVLASDLNSLQQKDPELLASAIYDLSYNLEEMDDYVVDDKTKHRLVELLSHEDEEVRDNASYIFKLLLDNGEVLDPSFMQLFLTKLKAQENHADQFAYLVGLLGSPKYVPALLEALNSNKLELQRAVIQALGRIGHESALPGMFDALESKDEDLRESIIEAVAKINHKDALNPLINALSDKNPRLRYEAAIALGELGIADAVDPLINYLKTDGADKRALEALDKLEDRRVIPYLADELAKGNFYDQTAVQAIHMLRDFNAENQAFDGLVVTAKDKYQDDLARITAIAALGKTNNFDASPILLKLLNNKKESSLIRRYAVQSLGDLKDADTVSVLRAVAFGKYKSKSSVSEKIAELGSQVFGDILKDIRQDQDLDLIGEAILGLGKHQDHESYEFIVGLLQSENTPETILKSSIKALGFMGEKEAVKPLTQALNSNDKYIRQEVIRALSQIESKLAIPSLVSVLKNDSDYYVRSSALDALGNLNNRDVIPELLEALNDSEYLIRTTSNEALVKISNTESVEQYIQILNNAESPTNTRKELVKVLSNFNQTNVIEALLTISNNESSIIRKDAIAALGELKAKQAADTLLEISKDDTDEEIQITSIVALAQIGNEEVIPELVKIAKNNHSHSLISSLCVFKSDPRSAEALHHISMHARKAYTRKKTRCLDEF